MAAKDVKKKLEKDLKLKIGSTPAGLLNLYAAHQVLSDVSSADADEVEWALRTSAGVFKVKELEKIFASIVGSLLQKDRKSCNTWASSLSTSDLEFILQENPTVEEIPNRDRNTFVSRILEYVKGCKLCVALAIAAADVVERWNKLAPEDKQFVTSVIERLGKSPHFSGTKSRALWDRLGSRYIVVDCLGADQLAQCPRWVLNARFDAPWRGPGKKASFIYLFHSYCARGDATSAAAVVDYLAKSHTDPDSELKYAAKDFFDDADIPNSFKSDFLIAFISACRRLEGNAQIARSAFSGVSNKGAKKAKDDEVYGDPITEGWELVCLENAVRQFAARPAGSGLDANDSDAELGDMLQAVLLLSKESTFRSWAKEMAEESPAMLENTKKFLKFVAGNSLARSLQKSTSQNGSFQYDDDKAAALIRGSPWTCKPETVLYTKLAARPAEDVGQLFRMYVKLDIAIDGGGLWSFMQTLEGDVSYLAQRFNKVAPPGSSLRKAVAEDIRGSFGKDLLNELEISRLLSYVWFFNPAFQRFLKTVLTMPCDVGSQPEHIIDVLEAMVKVLSMTGKAVKYAPQEMMSETWEQCRRISATLRLIRPVSKRVIESSWDQTRGAFDLKTFRDCAKELFKAGLVLSSKLKRGVTPKLADAVEAVVASMVMQNAPETWASCFRSLDTVIFTLEYMEKEDLKIAYQHFEEECAKHERSEDLLSLLKCVKQIYTEPLATASLTTGTQDGKVGDVIRNKPFKMERGVQWHGAKFGPAEWKMILNIAACAAEVMQKRYNVLMLPHHTQMIVVLMFAIRACRTGAQQAGFGQLPKTFLARVGTGEGKSMVIGMLASFIALKGLRAHVVNDDVVLTQRDYALNNKLFEALGIRASCDPRDLKKPEVRVVYCTGRDVEESLVDCLTQEGVEAFEKSLQSTVLIVDEVDGLILDKGVITEKLFYDATMSDAANKAFQQIMNKGALQRDADDFRAQGEFPGMADLEAEVQAADTEAAGKKDGRDFTVRGDEIYMLDPKTKQIDQSAWALWLEVKRAQRKGATGRIRYKFVKAVLSRIQCFMSYACIFGVTGSLGQNAEKKYLAEHYEAVAFNVPYFLDTCRNDSGGVQGKTIPTQIGKKTPFPNSKAQEDAVVSMAVQKCNEVPVLIIVKDPEAVNKLCSQIDQVLRQRDDASPIEDDQRVLPLLHNPREPEAFVELVDLSTEPLKLREKESAADQDGDTSLPVAVSDAAAAFPANFQRWRITVTTAEGGRGHDYRVVDPAIDEAGGLLLILTWVPWSEREWIQFLGRTGRQDHAGQYATLMNAQDDKIKAIKYTEKDGDQLIGMIMKKGDEETAKVLQANEEKIRVGKLMHRLTARFWGLAKKEKTTPFMDWDWKVLCESYSRFDRETIKDRFENTIAEDEDDAADDDLLADNAAQALIDSMPGAAQDVVPASMASAARSHVGPRAPPKDYPDTFILRKIDFFGERRKVLMHLGGTKSILLAICNVLLLRDQLKVEGGRDGTIKMADLLVQLSNALLDMNFNKGDGDASLTDALDLLQVLNQYHEVYPRFEDISSFETLHVLSVFKLLDMDFVHGWVIPLDHPSHQVVSQMNAREAWYTSDRFDMLQLDIEKGKSFSDQSDLKQVLADIEIMEKAPSVKAFLDVSKTELTEEGVGHLREAVHENALVVFFRRGEFFTMIKFEDDLYVLLTEAFYMDTKAVWARAAVDDRDTRYTDSKFQMDAAQRRRRKKAQADLPQPRAEVVSATRARLICPKCGKTNQFPIPANGGAWPKVRCGACGNAARPLPPEGWEPDPMPP